MLQRAESPVALTGVEASRSFFAPCFAQSTGESLWVAHLDAKARCIHLASYDGDVDSVDIPAHANHLALVIAPPSRPWNADPARRLRLSLSRQLALMLFAHSFEQLGQSPRRLLGVRSLRPAVAAPFAKCPLMLPQQIEDRAAIEPGEGRQRYVVGSCRLQQCQGRRTSSARRFSTPVSSATWKALAKASSC